MSQPTSPHETHADLDRLLDRSIAELRDAAVDETTVDAAAGRAWSRVALELDATQAAAAIQGCADYQAMIPDALAGRLSAARQLLLEDHTRECPACRKALWQARQVESDPRPLATEPATGLGARVGWLKRFGRSEPAVAAASPRTGSAARRRWMAVAAALVLGLGLTAAGGWLPGLLGPVAHAETVEGALYRVGDVNGRPIAAGTALRAGEAVRTARGARALLRLSDGSLVEMRERSDLVIRQNWRDTSIQVGRGDIIVRATDQGAGQLLVTTDDCQVAVKGTIFTLNHGLKGSRVAVLEGKVRFSEGQNVSELQPGEQASTGPDITPVPIEDQVAWSRDATAYRQLLAELKALRTELATIPRPGLRHDTRLLDRAPADTVAFLSFPNLSATLGEAHAKLQARIAASPVLRAWWAGSMGDDHDRLLTELSTHLDGARHLGDEIVLLLRLDAQGKPERPVLLSTVKDEAALRRAIAEEATRVKAKTDDLEFTVVDDLAALPAEPTVPMARHETSSDKSPGVNDDKSAEANADAGQPTPDRVYLWVKDGLFVASPSPSGLRDAVVSRPGAGAAAVDGSASPSSKAQGGTAAGAAQRDFRKEIAAAYAEGVDWLVAVDIAQLLAAQHLAGGASATAGQIPSTNPAPSTDQTPSAGQNPSTDSAKPDQPTATYGHDDDDPDAATALGLLGLADARYLVVRLEDAGTQVHQKADLVFDGPRRGMAAWLAEPGPMGTLDYLSPDTHFAAAFVVKSPASFLGEVQDFLSAGVGAGDKAEIKQAMDEAGMAEFAAVLGGEVAVALDGPVLPQPSWKVIAEVYDPARFQQAMVRLVAKMNEVADDEGESQARRDGMDGSGPQAQPEAKAQPDLKQGPDQKDQHDGLVWNLLTHVHRVLRAHLDQQDPPGAMAQTQDSKLLFRLEESTLQDHKVYALLGPDPEVAVYYLFDNGYWIAAPSRAVLDAALRYRATGTTLPTAQRFRALLPADGQLNVSALVFQDLGAVAGPLGQLMSGLAGGMPGQLDGPGALDGARDGVTGGNASPADAAGDRDAPAANALPPLSPDTLPASLTYAYARPNAIQVAGTSDQIGLGLGLAPWLAGLGHLGAEHGR